MSISCNPPWWSKVFPKLRLVKNLEFVWLIESFVIAVFCFLEKILKSWWFLRKDFSIIHSISFEFHHFTTIQEKWFWQNVCALRRYYVNIYKVHLYIFLSAAKWWSILYLVCGFWTKYWHSVSLTVFLLCWSEHLEII